MSTTELPNGDLQIPLRAEGDGTIGDGVRIVRKGDSDYDAVRDAMIKHRQKQTPPATS